MQPPRRSLPDLFSLREISKSFPGVKEIQVVPEASVAENITLDKLPFVSFGGRVSWKRLREEASVFMREVGLHLSPTAVVRRLSAAHKQLIQIARALVIGEYPAESGSIYVNGKKAIIK